MLVTPLSLRTPIARLRKVAMAAGRCRRGPGRRLRRRCHRGRSPGLPRAPRELSPRFGSSEAVGNYGSDRDRCGATIWASPRSVDTSPQGGWRWQKHEASPG
jgi:hypothetical protein